VQLVICDLNQKASPLPLTVRLAELASVNVYVCWKFLCFANAYFFLRDLFDEPLFVFCGCLFFHRRSFLLNLFAFFEVAFLSSEVFFDEPLCIFLGCLFFSSEVFFAEPLCVFLGLPLFSSEVFFDEPMNEGSESTPLFVASLVCAKALVECQANLVSYFDLALS
jgi:hypothetical protein